MEPEPMFPHDSPSSSPSGQLMSSTVQYTPSLSLPTPLSGLTQPDFIHFTGFNIAEGSSPFITQTQAHVPQYVYSVSRHVRESYPFPASSSPSRPGIDRFVISPASYPWVSKDDVSTGNPHPATSYEQERSMEVPPLSGLEHIVAWDDIRWNAVVVNGPRTFVPQPIYQPGSEGDMERYVVQAKLNAPIIFHLEDSPEWGIPVMRLLSRQPPHLVEGDKPAFASCGPSIAIRVQWPGYRPYHKQVSTRDFTTKRRMISKAKLAKLVAKCIGLFMDKVVDQAMGVGSDRRWKVAPTNIRLDDIILVSLHHVSKGSWQPQLRLCRDLEANIVAETNSQLRS